MSSALGMLAYVLKREESPEATNARLEHARAHLQRVHQSTLVETRTGDTRSGLIGWSPADDNVQWDFHTRRGNSGTSWLHVPSAAGGPETQVDPWALATAVLAGDIHPADVGSPFAVARWSDGQLDIVNDVLGLVRLFHYELPDGDVWATRQGLAHVFMAAAPTRNVLAWSGMATIGWAPGGETQLGHGRQMPGGSRVRAGHRHSVRYVDHDDLFPGWLTEARARPQPSAAANVRDMELAMSAARRWPENAMADLSGGKDSRTTAALGIRSGSVAAVRTINTDHGEVATAKQLMATIGHPVPHLIQEKSPATGRDSATFHDRLATQHRAFEGRFLAATAFGAGSFTGFRISPRARFNGLGGEVVGGGNFATGRWRDKVVDAPLAVARDRLAAMARVGSAATPAAKEAVAEYIAGSVDHAAAVGLTTAGEALDLFYCRDRMPHWSNTFTTTDVICPLFAPSLLTMAAHTMGAPVDEGELHRRILREAMPAWEQIPFYKPTSLATRATVPLWGTSEWPSIVSYVGAQPDSGIYSTEGIYTILNTIATGDPGKPEENAIRRYLWDRTFDDYVAAVASEAQAVRDRLEAFGQLTSL